MDASHVYLLIVCIGDLDLREKSKLISFKSLLTTFKVSNIFFGSCGSCENWLEARIKPSNSSSKLIHLCSLELKSD